MDRDMLDDQRELVDLIEDAGWEVTGIELSSYDSPWVDEDAPEAEVTITARKPYVDGDVGGDGDEDGSGEGDEDDSPFRIN
ncbi:hypothetical protein [Natronosalvus rutilus]|uniref:Uncharacterized protein n=1 Tax=Natronosalvus rutilus TaxID=2953753 RepID=A0A9E7SXJ6_9EURY|nr:hypothetical protein [Natronosalvus rutilus]UTF55136.1 hypothetical protein NGM29_07760 [Natronosalvus rutilus]